MSFARYALYCGGAAGVASIATVMLSALAEGRSPFEPVNATSHWLWGDKAGMHGEADLAHTLTGAITNQSAAMFWGALFGAWLSSRPPRSTGEMFRDAAVTGAIATTIDYGILPRRLSPGWELSVSRPSVVIGMAAMALGLALGGLAAQEPRVRLRRSRYLAYAA